MAEMIRDLVSCTISLLRKELAPHVCWEDTDRPSGKKKESRSETDDMRIAPFRTGVPALFSFFPAPIQIPPPRPLGTLSISPSPPFLPFSRNLSFPSRLFSPTHPPRANRISSSFASTNAPRMERQFEEFRAQLEESGSIRERIRAVAMEMESAIRLMHSSILLVHQSLPVPQVLEKAEVQIGVLKDLFGRLAEIICECPGQYYRFHGDWKSETQTAVSLLAFLHWLETGNLLTHREAEEKLGLGASEFGLDIEDYLTGLCFMSNELPRYVVNQVTAGDYDCPRNVLKFLTDLHASFRMLNLRNDFLRKKFDGMKYDLRRVEDVYYDVKIRGLAGGDSVQDTKTQS